MVRIAGLDRRIPYPTTVLVAYTPYVAALAIAGVLLALALAQHRQALAIALSAAALVTVVAPRAISDDPPDPRPQGPELKVLGLNLHQGDASVDGSVR